MTVIININGKVSYCEYLGLNTKVTTEQIDEAFNEANEGDYFLGTLESGIDNIIYAVKKAKEKKMKVTLIPVPIRPDQSKKQELIELLGQDDNIIMKKEATVNFFGVNLGDTREEYEEKLNECYEKLNNNDLCLIIYFGPAKGLFYRKDELHSFFKPPKIEPIDEALCSPACAGGFVYKQMIKEEFYKSIKFAYYASAYCSLKKDTINSLPTEEDVEKLIELYKKKK